MKIYDHIIIGASQAGLTAARTIRENRKTDSLLVINGEDRLPYKRTHLTKKLARGFEKDELVLYPESWYGELDIQRIDSPALSLDPEKREIELGNGERIKGKKILLATGALPLVPDIPGKEEILHLRTARDTEQIREKLLKADSVLIIGQGVEGVEMGEQCRLMGLKVTSTSTSSRLMSRWLDEELSSRLEKLLVSKGVEIWHEEKPVSLSRKKNSFELILTKGEREIKREAQVILASTGIRGNGSLLSAFTENLSFEDPRELMGNGPGVRGGIITDEFMQSPYQGVYAAGDAVQMPPGWASGLWHSSEKQGQTAALNMAGIITPRENTPIRLKCEVFGDFFFSMAFDRVKIEPFHSLDEMIYHEKDWYVRVFFKQGKALGALMQGLGLKAKDLAHLVESGADRKAFKNLID